jgi:hypothetical protein
MKALTQTSQKSEQSSSITTNEEAAQDLLEAKEAAPFLNISPITLLRWARKGLVPAHPLSGTKRRSWRFLAAELEAWALSRVNSNRDWCQNSRRQ